MMSKVDTSFKKKLNEDMYTDDQITQNVDNWHVNEPDFESSNDAGDISDSEFISFLQDEIKKYEAIINDYKTNKPNDSNINFFIDNVAEMRKTLDSVKRKTGLGENVSEQDDTSKYPYHIKDSNIDDFPELKQIMIHLGERFGDKIHDEFFNYLNSLINKGEKKFTEYSEEERRYIIDIATEQLKNYLIRRYFQ